MRLLGTALALLTAAFCAPGRAEAGCSHDVAAVPLAHDRLALLEEACALATIAGPDDDAEAGPPRKGRPGGCTGPSCSGRSGLPTVPPSVASPRSSEWAAIEPRTAYAGQAREAVLDEARIAWSNPPADRIFHPPRPPHLAR
ncbi:hypothetical protein OJF2_29320 [Aquisphaera giovannonii]|uniref:Uncharacterized protein n=2 Tax=Aquisphaera giovannonii TaxID=406548 RepID=A0A5B9W1G3_9BACT|nr:hypothetical protein OJF2_29320 [Aquisphaera giovannonii]